MKVKGINIEWIIGTILSLGVAFILDDSASCQTMIKNHPQLSLFVIILSVFTLLTFIISYCRIQKELNVVQRKNCNQLSLNKLVNIKKDSKRYSVILVDDDWELRRRYKDSLGTYDICILKEVNNTRLLHGFDIIILDIMGTSRLIGETGIVLIDELYSSVPYKYIIAISQKKSELEKCKHKVDKIILKDADFDENLSQSIKDAFSILDDPAKYWEINIDKKISNSKMKEIHKKDYLYALLQHDNFEPVK